MTLDEFEALEKSATPNWRPSYDNHFQIWEVFGSRIGNGHPYPKIFHGATESNSRVAAISRNTVKEVIALVREIDKAFDQIHLYIRTDSANAIGDALDAFKKKLGEQ